MTDSIGFSQVRTQFLSSIAQERELPSNCSKIATFIFSTYANSSTGECFPSFQTVADRLGLNAKTVKRAVNKLEEYGYIITVRGTNRGTATVYKPTNAALRHAKLQNGKGSNTVPLTEAKGGQECLSKGTKLSEKEGHESPPNKPYKQISKTDAAVERRTKDLRVPVVFVETDSLSFSEWDKAFTEHLGLGVMKFVKPEMQRSRPVISLPSLWPPSSFDEQLKAVERVSGSISRLRL